MSRQHTQRDVVLLMAREIDPQEGAPEDDEYISEWVPEHSCGGAGDPGCAACWMHDYDARAGRSGPVDAVVVEGRAGEAGHRLGCDVVVEGATWPCTCSTGEEQR